MEEIFLRSIFEALVESLDLERPGGQFGRPCPWGQDAKNLKNMHYQRMAQSIEAVSESTDCCDQMLGVAIGRVSSWCSYLCGFLQDTIELDNT